MSRNAPAASGGAPRWTYVTGAIVAIAGLLWTVSSYFVPHPPSPAPTHPQDSPAPSVSVSGSGIAVGQMYGGKIIQQSVTPVGSHTVAATPR